MRIGAEWIFRGRVWKFGDDINTDYMMPGFTPRGIGWKDRAMYCMRAIRPGWAERVKPGEIMVCQMTNPAWVVVFSKIKGVVTDTGGVLCHTAVVAREFGIPGVVGTGDATHRIKTGARLRVNGNTGLVEILG